MAEHYLYVMGSESGAGKSLACLGILAQLLASGYTPNELAYIKPVTQCTDKQAVTYFCERAGIAHESSQLLFGKGYTRCFIDGLTKDSASLKAEVLTAIKQLGANKKIIVIDGIGDPATGSVVGVSNADLAQALTARVVFVGRPGIGAAIDNIVLCVSFIHRHGLDNVGLIINKVPLNQCIETKAYVKKRLAQLLPSATFLGAIADDRSIEHKLKHQLTAAFVSQWFSAYIERSALLAWMRSALPG